MLLEEIVSSEEAKARRGGEEARGREQGERRRGEAQQGNAVKFLRFCE